MHSTEDLPEMSHKDRWFKFS